jgi:hypothetical protein
MGSDEMIEDGVRGNRLNGKAGEELHPARLHRGQSLGRNHLTPPA